jgi:hypothetical protein
MPRHAFKFPTVVVEAVRAHVQRAIEGLDPGRYAQEPNYTAALLGRLEGPAYKGPLGEVTFRNTVFNDRGARSAESRYGADHAITATISDGKTTINKVILVQAKLGRIANLPPSQQEELRKQIAKMRKLVPAPKVMEIPEMGGQRFPAIISGNRILRNEVYVPMYLPDYFVARITTTLDGCTNPSVVARVKDSGLPQLQVSARIEA